MRERLAAFGLWWAEVSAASAKVEALTVPAEQASEKMIVSAHLRVAGGLLNAIVPPAA